MTLILHDSGRNWKVAWALEALQSHGATGVVLTPFETPLQTGPNTGTRASARTCVELITDAGGVVLLDPMTHGVLAPGANAFDIYDGWDLWGGARGDLSTKEFRQEHVERVVARQHELGLPGVAPTLILDSSSSQESERVLEMAEATVAADRDAFLALAGSPGFWSQGPALDEFVGELAGLRPGGCLLTLARGSLRLSPLVDAPDEVQGICRSVHSLSLRSLVHVQHADLCGLPAIAAGATSLGTGWDLRQRIWAAEAFRRQSTGGQAARRVTHRGLLAIYRRQEAELLRAADAALSSRLIPGGLPATMKNEWEHHLAVLGEVVERIQSAPNRRQKVARLMSEYDAATQNFDQAATATPAFRGGAVAWIEARAEGLRRYAVDEGLI